MPRCLTSGTTVFPDTEEESSPRARLSLPPVGESGPTSCSATPHSREGDVRIYSEAELRHILGTWFSDVSWRRVGLTACVAVARKGA